jgi:hypothetical protein
VNKADLLDAPDVPSRLDQLDTGMTLPAAIEAAREFRARRDSR